MKATKARLIVKIFGCSDALWGFLPNDRCMLFCKTVEQQWNSQRICRKAG